MANEPSEMVGKPGDTRDAFEALVTGLRQRVTALRLRFLLLQRKVQEGQAVLPLLQDLDGDITELERLARKQRL